MNFLKILTFLVISLQNIGCDEISNETESSTTEIDFRSNEQFEEIQNEALKNLDWKINEIEGNMSEEDIFELVSKPKIQLFCKVYKEGQDGEYERCCDIVWGVKRCCVNYGTLDLPSICTYSRLPPTIGY